MTPPPSPGVYKVNPPIPQAATGTQFYARWDGAQWMSACACPVRAAESKQRAVLQNKRWSK